MRDVARGVAHDAAHDVAHAAACDVAHDAARNAVHDGPSCAWRSATSLAQPFMPLALVHLSCSDLRAAWLTF